MRLSEGGESRPGLSGMVGLLLHSAEEESHRQSCSFFLGPETGDDDDDDDDDEDDVWALSLRLRIEGAKSD